MVKPGWRKVSAAFLFLSVSLMVGFTSMTGKYGVLIRSEDAETRSQAVSEITEHRKSVVSELVGIVQDNTMYQQSPGSVVAAMRLLGILRAKDAVAVLAEHLDFQDPSADTPTRPFSVLNGREAVFALTEIGKPSVAAVMREGLRTDNHIKLMCAAAVIERVEGKETALFLLQRAFKKEVDTAKQDRLRKLMKAIQEGAR